MIEIKDYNSIPWNDLVYYSSESKTGLKWKNDVMSGVRVIKSGTDAGCIYSGGYGIVTFKGNRFAAHRIIWILHYGKINKQLQVDHIDGNRLNNHISNLRVVRHEVNGRNQKLQSNNNTGISGVFWELRKSSSKELLYASVDWHEYTEGEKCRKRKRFSVSKLGLLPAFSLAVKFREDQIKRLNLLGYNYLDRHGTKGE
jgi:hypothetical protein